ncbi:GNAT family N-acetyltransferase [Xylanimonas protaetiae]|uniref:GNAT family N-acetyltransferase n=1 Tax=Xylanimonas protaetiae TaxID=2509457 RepID=A0A4P6F3M4_9MICO|nr:GNAT family N-acetyltransferase [Xylanimonas protaetiae]QAY69273.1 GNAT family N-acetyltransferase [Xylanimonas protaetiae]
MTTLTLPDLGVLDAPQWSSLTGAHAHLAEGNDLVLRYPVDVSPFAAVRSWDHPDVWDAIVDVVGHGATFPGPPVGVAVPPGWRQLEQHGGVQLVETEALRPRPDAEAVVLGEADVPEMLALVERSRPGPFLPRTYTLGRYVGFRREGRLVAMAGERLRPTGWTEISAVTTDPEHRGQGLATRLVLDVAHHVRRRGDHVMLHASAANDTAIRLYRGLGFALRRTTDFGAVLTPEA